MKLEDLYEIIADRKKEMPHDSYTATLFSEGVDRIVQKVGEEAIEVVIAAKNSDRTRMIEETADLIFHLLVLLNVKNISLDDIELELKKRHTTRDK